MQKVEVFEVGKRQLGELVDHDLSFSCGDYVVVSMGAVFGRVSDELNLIERYCSEYWAFRSAEEMQRISCTFAAAYGRACVCDYEVWHVVDDTELWADWELRAAMAWADSPDYDFDELAEDAYPFGDCWESCIEACEPHAVKSPCEHSWHNLPCGLCPYLGMVADCEYYENINDWDTRSYYVVEFKLWGSDEKKSLTFSLGSKAKQLACLLLFAPEVDFESVNIIEKRKVCFEQMECPF